MFIIPKWFNLQQIKKYYKELLSIELKIIMNMNQMLNYNNILEKFNLHIKITLSQTNNLNYKVIALLNNRLSFLNLKNNYIQFNLLLN